MIERQSQKIRHFGHCSALALATEPATPHPLFSRLLRTIDRCGILYYNISLSSIFLAWTLTCKKTLTKGPSSVIRTLRPPVAAFDFAGCWRNRLKSDNQIAEKNACRNSPLLGGFFCFLRPSYGTSYQGTRFLCREQGCVGQVLPLSKPKFGELYFASSCNPLFIAILHEI